jgi:hypothetical protein
MAPPRRMSYDTRTESFGLVPELRPGRTVNAGKVARVERRPDERRYLHGRPRQQRRRSGLIDLVFNGLDNPGNWAGGLAATEVSEFLTRSADRSGYLAPEGDIPDGHTHAGAGRGDRRRDLARSVPVT